MIDRKQYRELYRQGITDRQAAKLMGASPEGIWYTRHALGLPVASAKITNNRSVPMASALTEDQCSEMRRFLRTLRWAANQMPRERVDVGAFMREFVGRIGRRGLLNDAYSREENHAHIRGNNHTENGTYRERKSAARSSQRGTGTGDP